MMMKSGNRKTLIAIAIAAAGLSAAAAHAEGLNFRLAMAGEHVAGYRLAPTSAEAPAVLHQPPVTVYGDRDAAGDARDELRIDLAASGMSALSHDEDSLLFGDHPPSLNLGAPSPAAGDAAQAGGLPQYALAGTGARFGSWQSAHANDPGFDAAADPYVFGLRLTL